MILNHSCREQFSWDRPRKLKHLTLSSVYYKLLNTSYILTYNGWKYCRCNEFQSCRSKPINGIISDRNYCYVCRVGVTYNEEKIRNIKKYRLFITIFLKLKKIFIMYWFWSNFQLAFWMYHYKTSYITGLGNCKLHYLKSFIDEYVYVLSFNDK